jgi:hypothetical protein
MANGKEDYFISDPNDVSTWMNPPSRLYIPNANAPIPAPVETRPQVLPLHELTWENFERLCFRLLELEAKPIHAEEHDVPNGMTNPTTRMYGVRGQAQYGIDMYARDPMKLGEEPLVRRYISLQAKRLEEVSEDDLQKGVDKFLFGKWSPVTRKFIYATSYSGLRTQIADKIERVAACLAQQSMDFDVWDRETISHMLREQPLMVYDFFGRSWVSSFCGELQADKIKSRLDANQVISLRKDLLTIYKASFQIADSGQLALKDKSKSMQLKDRYVTPDVISTTLERAAEHTGGSSDFQDSTYYPYRIAPEKFVVSQNEYDAERHSQSNHIHINKSHAINRSVIEERVSAETWIGTSSLQVVVGEPGIGKSSLLRHLVLDLLCDNPNWNMVAEKWGNRLPIWLPFHYFTQRISNSTGKQASISETIKAWLEQHDRGEVWPLVNEAFSDDRLLLVVDGLDEWVSDESGRLAMSTLETLASANSIAVIASTRPYGLARLSLGVNWKFVRVAHLTEQQQSALATVYFATAIENETDENSVNAIDTHVSAFLSEIRSLSDLQLISRVPLFMVLLIGLKLSSNTRLPSQRFEVYERAVKMLIADHPQRRRTAAAVTFHKNRLSERDVQTLIGYIAYVNQVNSGFSNIPETDIRKDLISALSDPENFGYEPSVARIHANDMLDIAEGEIGLLVRRGVAEFGFLHRMILEQLAAEYISNNLEPDDIVNMFVEYTGNPLWREVLLAVMWRTKRPKEQHKLIDVIESKIGETTEGLQARELIAELVFGEYGLPINVRMRVAAQIIDVVETHSYGAHRMRLMSVVLSGLNNNATHNVVDECVRRWAIQTCRPSANMLWHVAQLTADVQISTAIIHTLLHGMRRPDISLAFGAANAIINRYSDVGTGNEFERTIIKEGLIKLISDPPSGISQSAALAAFIIIWREDALVNDFIQEARSSSDDMVRLVALAELLGILAPYFNSKKIERGANTLQEHERSWLLDHLESSYGTYNMDNGLLVSCVVHFLKVNPSELGNVLELMKIKRGANCGFVWEVAIRAFPDNDHVINNVCKLLRSDEHLFPLRGLSGGAEILHIYADPSPQNDIISKAVEDHLLKFGHKLLDRGLLPFADVYRGPVLKNILISGLKDSSIPHWCSLALGRYFAQDEDVKKELKELLMGDTVQASRIANAAIVFLNPYIAARRLLDILRDIYIDEKHKVGRTDIVVDALIEVCDENEMTSGDIGESIASEALEILSCFKDLTVMFDARVIDLMLDIAAAFHSTPSAKVQLKAMTEEGSNHIIPFLHVYRNKPEKVNIFLNKAFDIMRSLPVQMKINLCHSLSDLYFSHECVMDATKCWADEISDQCKSYASQAYHRALIVAKNNGMIDDEKVLQAKDKLKQELSCYGPDYEARRRAAWVGMCILSDWSLLDGLYETIGESAPVQANLGSYKFPDVILLHQIGLNWNRVKLHLGDDFLNRLSGRHAQNPIRETWGFLSVIASQYTEIGRALEMAVEGNCELLNDDNILIWYLSQLNKNLDVATIALTNSIKTSENNLRGSIDMLIAEPEYIGIARDELKPILEINATGEESRNDYGNRSLEALAILFPKHNLVEEAWSAISKSKENGCRINYHPQTYFSIIYSCIENDNLLHQLRHDIDRLNNSGNIMFGEAISKHVSFRLKRDNEVAQLISEAIIDPATSDGEAAVLSSLLSASIPLPSDVVENLKHRLDAQMKVDFASIVCDVAIFTSMPVKNLLIRVIEAAQNSVNGS